MKIRLPLVFDVTIDEATLQDLQIDFGVAEARHLRGLDWSNGFPPNISGDPINAFKAKLEARQSLWKLLDHGATLPFDSPARLKMIVCLSALCQLFDVSAHIASASLLRYESGAYWQVEVRLTDRKGNFRGNWISISSVGFEPADYLQSLTAFLGAVIDGIRECVMTAFLIHEARDDQDVK